MIDLTVLADALAVTYAQRKDSSTYTEEAQYLVDELTKRQNVNNTKGNVPATPPVEDGTTASYYYDDTNYFKCCRAWRLNGHYLSCAYRNTEPDYPDTQL